MKNKHSSSFVIPTDLEIAQKCIYEPLGLTYKNLIKEVESEEYSAFDFEIKDKRIKYRIAKITPTKIGQFVTLWKRNGTGPILPYDISDPIDLFIVSVRRDHQIGQFIFPKAILHEKGIISKDNRGGKRAMRVYPTWDITDNRQAKKTQEWQLKYFVEISNHENSDITLIEKLLF